MRLALITLITICWPFLATAQSVEDQIVSQLRTQGYSEVTVTRTLLGRLRFLAISPDLERELIVNPATGVIIRDFWERRNTNGNAIIVPRAPASTLRDRLEDLEDRREDLAEEREERREERRERREERQDRRDDDNDDDEDDDRDDDDDDDDDDRKDDDD